MSILDGCEWQIPLTPVEETAPFTHWIGVWVAPNRSRQFGEDKKIFSQRGVNPRCISCSARSKVRHGAALSQLAVYVLYNTAYLFRVSVCGCSLGSCVLRGVVLLIPRPRGVYQARDIEGRRLVYCLEARDSIFRQ